MKISLFQGILFGAFVIAAVVGLFMFAMYSGGGQNSGGIGTVVVWGTLPKSAMKDTLTAITRDNTDAKGISYVEKDPATLPSDLAAAIATGSAPDLVLASQEQLLSLAKFIAPIPTGSLPESTFTKAFIDESTLYTVPGGAGYYGIPFLVDPIVLFSNNSILSSNGIASPPTTWEALSGLVSRVAVMTPSRQITRGLIALGTYDNVHDARGILSTLFLQTAVPISGYSANGVLTASLGGSSTSGEAPGQAVLRFYTEFADPVKLSYTWNGSLDDSQRAFQVGNLALYLGYASEARYFRAANPNLSFSVAPVPQPATASVKSTYGLVYAFMIPRGARNAAGAYEAAALLSNQSAQSIASSATGLAPVARAVLAAPPSDATLATAYTSALYAKGWLSPSPSDVDRVFSSMIGNVVSGRLTASTALANAESSLNSLLQ